MTFTLRRLLLLALLVVPALPAVAEQPYLSAADVDLARLLAPPPAAGSAVELAEKDELLAIQAGRTAEAGEAAHADSERSVLRFAGALGAGFTAQSAPLTVALIKEVAHEAEGLSDGAKAKFQRPRPFVSYPEITPILAAPTDGSRPPGRTPSYPSGHATFAALAGILLANMVPERSAAIFDRAADFAHNRLVAGVHYRSDVDAGRISGTVIANTLLHNPRFLADFAKARAETRQALGLPAD